jgi:hypothetical protein
VNNGNRVFFLINVGSHHHATPFINCTCYRELPWLIEILLRALMEGDRRCSLDTCLAEWRPIFAGYHIKEMYGAQPTCNRESLNGSCYGKRGTYSWRGHRWAVIHIHWRYMPWGECVHYEGTSTRHLFYVWRSEQCKIKPRVKFIPVYGLVSSLKHTELLKNPI